MDKYCKECLNLACQENHPAFCPNCGRQLIDNQWIGETIQCLVASKEAKWEEIQYSGRQLREMESRHKREIEPLRKGMETLSAAMKQIEEALSHARKHEIESNR